MRIVAALLALAVHLLSQHAASVATLLAPPGSTASAAAGALVTVPSALSPATRPVARWGLAIHALVVVVVLTRVVLAVSTLLLQMAVVGAYWAAVLIQAQHAPKHKFPGAPLMKIAPRAAEEAYTLARYSAPGSPTTSSQLATATETT